jgi:hypothetical protein
MGVLLVCEKELLGGVSDALILTRTALAGATFAATCGAVRCFAAVFGEAFDWVLFVRDLTFRVWTDFAFFFGFERDFALRDTKALLSFNLFLDCRPSPTTEFLVLFFRRRDCFSLTTVTDGFLFIGRSSFRHL